MIDRNLIRQRCQDKTVLFVDDDKQICFSWEKLLGRSFGAVFIANNGQSGLDIYKANKIDLVVTDITMPIMNGLDMAKELRKINQECKIIFTTGHNETEYIEKMAALGGLGLTKPVDMEDFLALILQNI